MAYAAYFPGYTLQLDIPFPPNHRLPHTWVFWISYPQVSTPGKKIIVPKAEFNTLAEFWMLHNNMEIASRLYPEYEYSFFRKGVEPKSEDRANSSGGCWVVSLERWHSTDIDIDTAWLNTITSVLLEDFTCGKSINSINGLSFVSTEIDIKLCLWIRSGECDLTIDIGNRFRDSLMSCRLPVIVVFVLHHIGFENTKSKTPRRKRSPTYILTPPY